MNVRIERHGDLGCDLASRRVCDFHDAVGARRVQLRTIDAEAEGPAAPLVSPRLPDCVDVPESARRRRLAVVTAGAARQPVGLHMPGCEAYSDNGLFWVECLREEVVVERNGAHILEHGRGGAAVVAVRACCDSFVRNFSVELGPTCPAQAPSAGTASSSKQPHPILCIADLACT